MEVKRETIEVIPQALAEPVGGARPEPEQMPARRILSIDSDATLGGGPGSGTVVGKFDSKLVYEEDAETFAQLGGKECHRCLHWSNDLWRKMYVKKFHDPEFRRDVNRLRARLPDGEEEEQIRAMGLCVAFTEVLRTDILTHPYACCPSEDRNRQPLPLLFTPKDSGSKRMAEAIYDKTLKMAQKRLK